MPDPGQGLGPPPRWGGADGGWWDWLELLGEGAVYLLDLLLALF